MKLLNKFLILFFISGVASAADNCEHLLESSKVSKYLLSKVDSPQKAQQLLLDYQLLNTQEFNLAIRKALDKKKIRLSWISEGRTYEYAEGLNQFLESWPFHEHFFIPEVLDTYLEILASGPQTKDTLIFQARMKELITDLKSTGMPRYVFSRSVRRAITDTLIDLTAHFSNERDPAKAALPLLSATHLSIHPMVFMPPIPIQARLRSALEPKEKEFTGQSIFKNKEFLIFDRVTLANFKGVETASLVDIAYLGQDESRDLSHHLAFLQESANSKTEWETDIRRRNHYVRIDAQDLIEKILQARRNIGEDAKGENALKNEVLKLSLNISEQKLLSLIEASKNLDFQIINELFNSSEKVSPADALNRSLENLKFVPDTNLKFKTISDLWLKNPGFRDGIINRYFRTTYRRTLVPEFLELFKDPSVSKEFKQDLYVMLRDLIGKTDRGMLAQLSNIAMEQGLNIFSNPNKP